MLHCFFFYFFISVSSTPSGELDMEPGTWVLWLLPSSSLFTAQKKKIHSIITMNTPCVLEAFSFDDGSFSNASVCLWTCVRYIWFPLRGLQTNQTDDASLKSWFPVEFTLSPLSSANCFSACTSYRTASSENISDRVENHRSPRLSSCFPFRILHAAN